MAPYKKSKRRERLVMARKTKLSIYEQIEAKQQAIKKTEELLQKLNTELESLYAQRDELEMKQLFAKMREKNLSIDKATELLENAI